MHFLDLANEFIPGYRLLSRKERKAFQASAAGKQFSSEIEKLLLSINSSNSSVSQIFWSLISNKGSQAKQKMIQEIVERKRTLLSAIENSKEYKTLIDQIMLHVLVEVYPDATLLNEEQQMFLARAEFSQVLQPKLLSVKDSLAKAWEKFNNLGDFEKIGVAGNEIKEEKEKLRAQQKDIINDWYEAFFAKEEMAPLRAEIAQKKAQKRATQLAKVFPLLNYPTSPGELNQFDQLVAQYTSENLKVKPNLAPVETKFLTDLLLHYIEERVAKQLGGFVALNTSNFNKKQANHLAKEILRAVNHKNDLQIDTWFTTYQKKLTQHILDNLYSINGKEWQIRSSTTKQQFASALSYLFHNKAMGEVNQFMSRMADAHAFIQATGFSTQNENSFLAILDFYNYGRYAEQITITKAIFANLLKPFLPLYEEYREIAFTVFYEKNAYRKIFSTVMPMLVIAGFVVFASALLAPLAITELAFFIASIPILFLGFALATKYVTLKNDLYQSLRQSYYGGPFEIPEFQINERMILSFGSKEVAEIIRGIYIEELKICDKIEASSQQDKERGKLTGTAIKLKEENIERRRSLCLEWYDIHSNINFGYDEVPQIVLERLREIADKEFKSLEKVLGEDDSKIKAAVKQVVEDLKTTFSSRSSVILSEHEKPSSDEIILPEDDEFLSDEDTLSENEESSSDENTLSEDSSVESALPIRAMHQARNYSPGLFTPLCIAHKCRAENADFAIGSISPK